MKKLLWFLLGIVGGFVAAHFMTKDPRGNELLASIDSRINGFTDALADAYRAEVARETND
ncbi:hypothetical protein GCM10010915_18500 [Microbacterium faecale]|uniref:Uncharacterized protein n=1 Tax=Microbacterium faecale TaxID=1804630 RepID=A0A917DHQ0_9MICO|nr:hypothetical protein [Microbacterium faecale]GGD37980.1 hypothetical protein GCM10010915_18500 [Microbacterium faecale]